MTDHRYFFCLRPPAPTARRIGAMRDGLECRGRIVTNERLHVTLGITNDYPDHVQEVAGQLIGIGAAIEAEPFRITLDRLAASDSSIALRPSRRPAGLGSLQRQIARRLACCGLGRAGWSFSPHMTLMYRNGEPFLRPGAAFEWEAAELVLIHSLVGDTKHVELGRWPLVRRQLGLAL